MNDRPYRGAADLTCLQHFNATQIATNPVGWLQPGDLPHRLYNGYREHDPAQLLHIWEDDAGEIVGWAFTYPDDAFDIQAHNPVVIWTALRWIESTLTADTLETDLWRGDDPRRATLLEGGYTEVPDEPPYYVTARPLHDPLPAVTLPDGFSIRAAAGVDDAARSAAVHAGAFDSDWTTGEYARVMRSPGYDPAREFVVVAPDGRFAAFAVTWHDSHNRTGYFEPVGTHADFLRRGLARAVMLYAMRAMQSAELVTAIVIHEPPEENPAPAGLYRGLGFQTQYTTHLYHKTRL